MSCSFDRCEKRVCARGLCGAHLQRLYRTGRASIVRKHVVPGDIYDRIRARIRIEGACWVYTRTRTRAGYGNVGDGGKVLYVHRVMALLYHGEPPSPSHEALHSCDNPPCCNPAHLRWGTCKDNAQDAIERGRFSRTHQAAGEEHNQAKLTSADVRQIRRRRANGKLLRVIASEFGVSPSAVSAIARRRSWKEVV